MTGVVSTPPSVALPQRNVPRRSSASRAVAAAQQESFPVQLSPSPLLRLGDLPTGKPKKITRYATEAALQAALKRPDPLAAEQERLAEFYTIVKGRTTLLSLSDSALRLVFQYVGSNIKSYIPMSTVCKRFYHLSFDLESAVTLIPTLVSTEKLSQRGSMTSLSEHLGRFTRGPHIVSFSIVDSKAVAQLPRTTFGPELSKIGLQSVLANLTHLVRLDVRGVVFRDHSPLTDHFLADLPTLCPLLEQLRVGGSIVRCWDQGWWSKLPHLTEFVVGSRREDVDWADPNPITLHEDVFQMLRSPHHKWTAVKLWCGIAPLSFQQLLNPTLPFQELRHLTVNALGNTNMRPLDEASLAADPAGGEKKKADTKGSNKKGGAVDDASIPKFMFPTLESFTVADTNERPDFASELAAKFSLTAPSLLYYNVTVTHRSAPTKAPPPTGKPKRGAAL